MACEHRGCKCDGEGVERDGQKFCSDSCATAQTQNQHQEKCPCGHSPCKQP